MKPISKEIRDLIGKPGAVPEDKKVAEQKVEVKAVEQKPAVNAVLKPVCQNCKNYSRQTKQCLGVGGQPIKFVPRKGTCEAFDTVKK
jgi:hypothetical protein